MNTAAFASDTAAFGPRHGGRAFASQTRPRRTPRAPDASAADWVEGLLGEILSRLEPAEQRAAARGLDIGAAQGRAVALAARNDDGDVDRDIAVVSFLAELVTVLSIEQRWSRERAAALFESVAELTDLSVASLRTSVCLRALRNPVLLELPAALTVETVLTLVGALAPVKDVSLWRRDEGGRLRRLASVGSGTPIRRARSLADDVLTAASARRSVAGGPLRAVPVLCWQGPSAALVFRAQDHDPAHASALAEEAAAVLGFVLEREMILERNAARERSLVESSERRLTRLAFDLHDGAIQDVMALAAEVRLFRDEFLRRAEPSDRNGTATRLDDLEERLLDVGAELRELSTSLEATSALGRSLRGGLEKQVESFRKHADAEATLDMTGDFDALTASQRIAVLRIVQEALANVREHSGASRVHVAASVAGGFVRAVISDDGCGFDVATALPRAAKNGRLGLVGMSERVRLLGGRMDVDSRPGGPTTISVVLRLWQPLARPSHGEDARAEGDAG